MGISSDTTWYFSPGWHVGQWFWNDNHMYGFFWISFLGWVMPFISIYGDEPRNMMHGDMMGSQSSWSLLRNTWISPGKKLGVQGYAITITALLECFRCFCFFLPIECAWDDGTLWFLYFTAKLQLNNTPQKGRMLQTSWNMTLFPWPFFFGPHICCELLRP